MPTPSGSKVTACLISHQVCCDGYGISTPASRQSRALSMHVLPWWAGIMSTGMASDKEIKEALETAQKSGASEIVLLHCISSYPTPPNEYNLRRINKLKKYGVLVGLSDHCTTNEIAIASVALGASVIEKHFTLDRKAGGLDDIFSLEPKDLKQLVIMTKNTYLSLRTTKDRGVDEHSLQYRQSVYPTRNIKKGEIFSKNNLKIVRPGLSIPAKYFEKILGIKAKRNIQFGERLTLKDF